MVFGHGDHAFVVVVDDHREDLLRADFDALAAAIAFACIDADVVFA